MNSTTGSVDMEIFVPYDAEFDPDAEEEEEEGEG